MTDPLPSFEDMPADPREIHKWLLALGRLDILRSRLTLSEMVGRTVPLEPFEHDEMRGACPAEDHDDDQKAFFVKDSQGIFHCFGCGIHGDAVRWKTDYEGVGYVDAVRDLIRQAGLNPSNQQARPPA